MKCNYMNPRWLKDGDETPGHIIFLDQILVITKVQFEHQGEYQCYDAITTAMAAATLYVASKIKRNIIYLCNLKYN